MALPDSRERAGRTDFVRHGVLVFSASMLDNGFNYLFHFLSVRLLGVAEYGSLFALFAVLALLSVPISVLTTIVVKYAAEFRVLGDRERLGALSGFVVRRTLVAAGAIVVTGVATARALADYLNIHDPRAVMATAVILGLAIILPGLRGILQGVEDFWRYAISTTIEAAGKFAFGVGLIALGFGVNGALAGFAIAIGLSIAYTAYGVRTHTGRSRVPLRVDPRRLARTLAGVGAATLAMSAFVSLDQILVKHYFAPDVAGLYSVVALVGKVLFFVIGFIPTILLPKATARAIDGKSSRRLLAQAGAAFAVVCGAGLGLLWAEPQFVIRFMSGASASGAAPYVFDYGLAMTFLGATSIAVAYKTGLHRFGFVPGLLAVAAAETVAIVFRHDALRDVLRIIVTGHATAFVFAAWRLLDPIEAQPGRAPAAR